MGWVQGVNALWGFGLYLRDVVAFYRYTPLRKADLKLMRAYGLQNPFRLSALGTQALGPDYEDLTVYGETPWCTLARIAAAVELQPGEHFVELGAGTGRNLLWAHYFAQVKASGYELIPTFVERFKSFENIPMLQLYEQNWFDVDLKALGGDVYLLVGTCYDDTHREQANDCLRRLPKGKRVITISYALPAHDFILQRSFIGSFSWGKGTVFIHEKL